MKKSSLNDIDREKNARLACYFLVSSLNQSSDTLQYRSLLILLAQTITIGLLATFGIPTVF